MGVRPPQQDDDSQPETVAFGIAALAAHLDEADLEFPATAEEVAAAVDDEIPYDAAGNGVRIEEVLDRIPQQEFETQDDLLDLLHPVFEDIRANKSGGVVSQLRSLLPF